MTASLARKPLGEILTSSGLISEHALEQALAEHRRLREPLGSILKARGDVRSIDLYRALARQLQLPFVDLLVEPPVAEHLKAQAARDYIGWRYIPWRRKGTVTVIACCDMNDAFLAFVEKRYGAATSFVITSPLDILWTVERLFGKEIDEHARNYLFLRAPQCSAKHKSGPRSAILSLTVAGCTLFASVVNPGLMMPAILVLCNLVYLLTLLFKLVLFTEGAACPRRPSPEAMRSVADDAVLPVYTILVPMYHEAAGIPRLLAALERLDYPKSKLDVKLIVEEDDWQTIEAIKAAKPCGMYEILRVPYSLPRTKPKACNVALQFAKGEFVTIYDAEDQPDPDQLKKAVAVFRRAPKEVVCLQARLNYYNRKENILTAMFAIEYAGLFDFMLPGLSRLKIPVPLGGTSNHFRVAALRALGEWDPYNVTEDADLGIRLASRGYKTWPLDSTTLEEAPVTLAAWYKQRARWIKGYMVTWRVAMRRFPQLFKRFGWAGFLGFQLFVGAATFVYLIAPVLWAVTVLWAFGVSEPDYLPRWIGAMSGSVFVTGILVQLLLALVTVRSRRWTGMGRAIVLFPVYWFLHSFASLRALWQLFTAPFHWDKTEHGVSKMIPAL